MPRLVAVPAAQRNLLRMYFVDGLSTTQIGALFQVNRSTAIRWLQAARDELRETTRRLMRERLRLSEGDLNSILGLLHSQVEFSIGTFLRAPS